MTLKPMTIAAVVAILAALAGGIGCWILGARLDAAQTEALAQRARANAFEARLREVVAANTAADTAILDLRSRLDTCVGQAQDVETAIGDAIAERDAATIERDRLREQLQKAREADYAEDPTCRAWGATPVCGRVTRRVREQWDAARGGDEAGGGGRAEAPARRDPR